MDPQLVKKRLLGGEKSKNIVKVLENLIDLKCKTYSDSSLANDDKKNLLNGFVCDGCYRRLETFHSKQEELLSQLTTVFNSVCRQNPATSTPRPSSLNTRKRSSISSSISSSSSLKRPRIDASSTDGKSPEVFVSLQFMHSTN